MDETILIEDAVTLIRQAFRWAEEDDRTMEEIERTLIDDFYNYEMWRLYNWNKEWCLS